MLSDRGYNLFLLASSGPSQNNFNFNYSIFWERLNFQEKYFLPTLTAKNYDLNYFSNLLKLENRWYGVKPNSRSLNAAFYLKNLYEILIEELNPCLAIIGNGHHATDVILNDVVESKKIPKAYIERGCLTNSWHLDLAGITAGSNIAQNYFEFDLNGDTNLFNIYEKEYFKTKSTWWEQPKTSTNISLREEYEINEDQKIVLFLNQLDNDTSNMLYSPLFQNNLDAINWFSAQFLKENLNSIIFVKKHPKLSDQLKHSINNLRNVIWIEDRDLFSCLVEVDLVCTVNSTGLYEALLHKKPVLQLGLSILSKKNIAYEIKNKNDTQILLDWYNTVGINKKINRFKHLVTYLISNELYFFSSELAPYSFPGADAFAKRLFTFFKEEREGNIPDRFLERKNALISKGELKKIGVKAQLEVSIYLFKIWFYRFTK